VYGCQQILISPNKDLKAILEYVCTEAKKLTNCGVYYSRQLYFKTGKIPSKADLHKQLGTIQKNAHYQALYSDTAQQILTTVAESFKSYFGLLKGIKEGTVTQKPKPPNYCKRKVAAIFKFDLIGVGRGCLSQPTKVLLWTLQKSPRLQTGEA
jgi:putative transposase